MPDDQDDSVAQPASAVSGFAQTEPKTVGISDQTPPHGMRALGNISRRDEIAGGVVPSDILTDALKRHHSSLIGDIAAHRTLTDMVHAYVRAARASEASFSGMYKERESSAPQDIDERERVAREIQEDRADARAFLHDIKDNMQLCDKLSHAQGQQFEQLLHPRQHRVG